MNDISRIVSRFLCAYVPGVVKIISQWLIQFNSKFIRFLLIKENYLCDLLLVESFSWGFRMSAHTHTTRVRKPDCNQFWSQVWYKYYWLIRCDYHIIFYSFCPFSFHIRTISFCVDRLIDSIAVTCCDFNFISIDCHLWLLLLLYFLPFVFLYFFRYYRSRSQTKHPQSNREQKRKHYLVCECRMKPEYVDMLATKWNKENATTKQIKSLPSFVRFSVSWLRIASLIFFAFCWCAITSRLHFIWPESLNCGRFILFGRFVSSFFFLFVCCTERAVIDISR